MPVTARWRLPCPGRRLLAALGWLLAVTMGPAPAAELTVLFLADPAEAAHARLLAGVKAGLRDTPSPPARLEVTDADGLAGALEDDGADTVLVAVGRRAAAATVASPALHLPVIYTLLTRPQYERLAAQRADEPGSGASSAIFLDQPFDRRLELVRAALPLARRIGVVASPAYAPYIPELRGTLALTARLRVQPVEAPGEVMAALRRVLPRSDVLLALPDPAVYNASTLKAVLLTSYRHRVPVVGFSRAFVEAGALVSLYSTPAQVGAQLAELLADRAADPAGPLPPPAFPRDFEVAVNPTVADSLGIHLLPAQELRAMLRPVDTHAKVSR